MSIEHGDSRRGRRHAHCSAVRRPDLAGRRSAQSAQRWPSERPIRLIVPFQAGSSSDTIARIVATEAVRAARPADRGRQPRRRQHHARHRGGRPRRSRTATRSGSPTPPRTRRRRAARQAALRSGQGLRAGGDDRQLAVRAAERAEAAGARHCTSFIALAKAKPGTLSYASAGAGSSRISPARCSRRWPASS